MHKRPQKYRFTGDSKDFETGTWMLKKSTIISIIVQDYVRPLTTGIVRWSNQKKYDKSSEYNNQ